MSALVPNLPELIARLGDGNDARAVAEAFDAETIEAARTSLQRITEAWDGRTAEADTEVIAGRGETPR